MVKRGLRLPKKRSFTAPASIFRRFLSYIIDFSIISAILFPLGMLMQAYIPSDIGFMQLINFMENNPELIKIRSMISFFSSLITVLYFSYFEYKIQQTPGKMIMKNVIIPEDKKEITFGRYVLSNILFAFSIIWLLDILYMLFSPKNQRLMERLTKILVVQKYEV